MTIRRTFRQLRKGLDVTVQFDLVSTSATGGKYLLGRLASDPGHIVLAFDEGASFHRDIALRYRLRPAGGGWLTYDPKKRRIHLSGRSQAYGREPDRDLAVLALSRAFPEFACTAE